MILAERLLAATGGGEHPHQRAMGGFVQRVDDDNLLERLDRRRDIAVRGQAGGKLQQQPQVRLAHRVAPAGRPRLIATSTRPPGNSARTSSRNGSTTEASAPAASNARRATYSA